MKAKGISKDAMQTMHHKDYVDCLTLGTSNTVRMQSIRSINQQLYAMEMFKKGLSCNDVKRWICPDGIHTEPYGYNPVEECPLKKDGEDCMICSDDEQVYPFNY